MKEKTPLERLGYEEHRAQLWDAIHDYVVACGGTPGASMYGNTKRQAAVAEVESLVYPAEEKK